MTGSNVSHMTLVLALPRHVEPDARREAELAEVAADLDTIQKRIIARKRELAVFWTKATTTDRLLAVDRLLRDGNLCAAQIAEIAALQAKVKAAFHTARESKRLSGSQVLHRVEADLSRAEADRDRAIGLNTLTEELWRTSETFVVPAHLSRQGPFRELLGFEALLEQRLLHLQGQSGEAETAVSAPEPCPTAPATIALVPPQPLPRLLQLLHSPLAAAGF